MRRALPLLCAAMLTPSGCLVPLPIEEATAEVNYPPFYRVGDVEPVFTREYIAEIPVDGTPPSVTFSVRGFDDPNPDDFHFYRWYLNYADDFVAQSGERTVEQRDRPIAFTFNPCLTPEPFRNDNPERELTRVELIVADRPFVPVEEQPPGTAAPDQVLPVDAGSFRIVWFMRFDRTACAPP